MKSFGTAILPKAWILGALLARPAMAADHPCPPMAVEVDAGVRARWPDLRERVHDAFEARDDIDACARVELTLSDAAIAVQVVLPDGRSASRWVSQREDVVPTLEALLLLPGGAEPAAAQEPPPAPTPDERARSTPVVAPPANVAPTAREAPARPPVAPAPVGVELSVFADARMTDGQKGVGLGAQSFLDLGGWLAGFEGHVERYQANAGGPPRPALELAVLGGRRFRFGSVALDLFVGPAMALQGNAESVTASPAGRTIPPPAGPAPGMDATSGTSPRALFGARLNFGAGSVLRTFVSVDGDIGPAGEPTPTPMANASRLPAWSGGLALGATVGTR
jgi:hypothetical protein